MERTEMNYLINTKENLESFFYEHFFEIESFINNLSQDLPLPIYSSVDIREGAFKYAPVDFNFYPAGFNNLCKLDLETSGIKLKEEIFRKNPHIKKVAILTESNTQNKFYLDHLIYLKRSLEEQDFEVNFISFDDQIFMENVETIHLISHSQFDVEIKRAHLLDGFIFDGNKNQYEIIILNNDQSFPIDIDWESLNIPVAPPPFMGWSKRQKNNFFVHYSDVLDQFSKKFSIDPDLLQAKFDFINKINYNEKADLEILAKKVDEFSKRLPDGSSIFIKASQGTYGMGISVVKSGKDVLAANRKTRKKMDVGKNGIKFSSFLIQEGVETVVKDRGFPAEISIYLVGGKSVGGFLRSNPQRTTLSNLNSKGMTLKKFCITEMKNQMEHKKKEIVYSIMARLATLASGLEIKSFKEGEIK